MSCVYIHINKINNKKYIGFSKNNNPEQRWGNNGSGYQKQKFYIEGILPFGWDNFSHKILIKDISISLAQTIEFYLIDKLDLIKEGYNEDPGVCHIEDKEIALSLLPNLINLIDNNKKNGLKSLDDIINIKYTFNTNRYRLQYIYLDLYKMNRINTNLDCQREYVWDEIRQQGMWDTLLYGHRIPELHAINGNDGTYDIIDGKQRLLTMMKILNNEIPLERSFASNEIKHYMINNNISRLYFKELSEILKNKIYSTSITIAEYDNVDEDSLILLFQKLNAGKPLSEFQKALANNIVVRIRYTNYFQHEDFITGLFSEADLNKNEDEIMLVRLFSALNCGNINNIDSLVQRELSKIIEKMDSKTLANTRELIFKFIDEMKNLGISSKDLSIINKTWYPLLFKYYLEEIPSEQKKYFKEFLLNINIPPQRGQESTKNKCIERYLSIKTDWNNFITKKISYIN